MATAAGAAVMAGKAYGAWCAGAGIWEGIAGEACGAGGVLAGSGGCKVVGGVTGAGTGAS